MEESVSLVHQLVSDGLLWARHQGPTQTTGPAFTTPKLFVQPFPRGRGSKLWRRQADGEDEGGVRAGCEVASIATLGRRLCQSKGWNSQEG